MATRYHATTGLPMIHEGGDWRVLGALKPHRLTALPDFADVLQVADASTIRECSVRPWLLPILNQGQYGSCVGHATVTAFSYVWKISGQVFYDFSPTFIYGLINGNRDAGAVVSDGLQALKTYGTCFATQVTRDMIFRRQFPAEAFVTAKRFRALEAYRIRTWEEMLTAITKGMICVSGIAVGDNFGRLDGNGVAPLPNRVIGGHALAHTGLKLINGEWVIETHNSWGKNWGQDGFCYLQKKAWHPAYGFGFDCFAIAAVADDPEEKTVDPPPLKHETPEGGDANERRFGPQGAVAPC